MKKLTELRKHLIAAVPGLARDPDRLLTFVESGAIEFHRGANLSHAYTIPAQIVLTDYSGELDAVILPLLYWLSVYEPDVVPAEAVRFDAEILSNNAWDLALTVTLTERVVATLDCDTGRIDAEHRLPDYPTAYCHPDHWQIYVRDARVDPDYQLVAEWEQADT